MASIIRETVIVAPAEAGASRSSASTGDTLGIPKVIATYGQPVPHLANAKEAFMQHGYSDRGLAARGDPLAALTGRLFTRANPEFDELAKVSLPHSRKET